jgi:hypothetical protein
MSTEFQTEGLRSFFVALEAGATSDVEDLARLYAPAIVVAGPGGSQVVSTADLLLAIPRRKQLFEAAGRRRTTLVGLHETPLDRRYTLARTEWQWLFVPNGRDQAEVTLPSTFIVEYTADGPRIVFYLMHADVGAVLRERGLLPSGQGIADQ